MERPSGKFNRLAKPAFDRDNPNAVLGEVSVPGLQQVCMAAQTQMFPKRAAVQQLKDRLQAWCAEENRREQEGVALPGGGSTGNRAPRTWRAYEFIGVPSRNRTLDSEVLGRNVGLPANDTRLEVFVDFEAESDAREVGMRLLEMTAEVSIEVNQVFGYADDAASGGEQLGPWKKPGKVNSWRKWLELKSGGEHDPLPESAVTVFRTVQANWADPQKIAAAMNFTVFWSTARVEESKVDPATPLLKVEVLHSALHPHVIKIIETFVSSDAMLDHFHRHYERYLEGVYDFRAAVNPTVQAYTPLEASLRPCLSTTLDGGAMVPLVAIGGAEDGAAPSTSIVLEGLKLGLRHVVLEAGSSGVQGALEGLTAALAFGVLKRQDLFVTMIVWEGNSTVAGGGGIATTVRETLASGSLDVGGIEADSSETRLLDFVDALVLGRESGDYFDDDQKFLEMWDEARQAAASSPRTSPRSPTVPTTETTLDEPVDDDDYDDDDDDDDDGTGVADPFDSSLYESVAGNPYAEDSPYDNVVDSDVRYSSIADGRGRVVNKPFFIPDEDAVPRRTPTVPRLSPPSPSSPRESGMSVGSGTIPKILPSLYFGDLRAGDVSTTAETLELCHNRGVQAFSLQYVGGEDGEEAGKGAAAAADYEYEDVTGDEVLARWVMDLGAGVVWRPGEMKDVARTLPLARYYLPPEWLTEIADRAGCPQDLWARTLSRLCPTEGTPSEDELGAEVDETVAALMAPDEGEGPLQGDFYGERDDDDDYDGLWLDD
eukprot:g14183.t1